jgi:hypothetical protein
MGIGKMIYNNVLYMCVINMRRIYKKNKVVKHVLMLNNVRKYEGDRIIVNNTTYIIQDYRIVCALNDDGDTVRPLTYSELLYFRTNQIPVSIPPTINA